MAFFHRKLYQQKPKQWGPISVVQASFFRNAEKAGFDPNTFRGLFPMWEGAGNQLIDLGVNGNHLSMNNYSWINQSVDLPGNTSQYVKNDTPIGIDGFKKGFVAGVIVNLDTYGRGSFMHHYTATNNDRCWAFENLTSSELACYLSKDGSITYSNWLCTNPLVLGEDGHVAVKWTSEPTVEFFFDGSYITTTQNVTLANPVSNIKTPSVPIPLEVGRGVWGSTFAIDGRVKFAYIIADCVTSKEQIAYIADNPYFLLHRNEPTFYSFPAALSGTVTWGHSTDVVEANSQPLSDWTGTGTVSGSGDAETITLNIGQYMESPAWNIGSGTVRLRKNVYDTGKGTPTIEYKQGSTESNCNADSWHPYSTPFTCEGWVKVAVSGPLTGSEIYLLASDTDDLLDANGHFLLANGS